MLSFLNPFSCQLCFAPRSNHYSTRSTLQGNEFLKFYIESSKGGEKNCTLLLQASELSVQGEREREKKIGTIKLTIEKNLVCGTFYLISEQLLKIGTIKGIFLKTLARNNYFLFSEQFRRNN